MVRLVLLSLFLSPPVQDPKPGTVIEKVACGPEKQYSYACYLPKKYSADKTWPILYCFSPAADTGKLFIDFYREACEEAGWILVCSNDSKNGPIQTEAIKAMWDDTRSRFSVDKEQYFLSGFSGGARVSWWLSQEKLFDPENCRGLILIAAARGTNNSTPPKGAAVWMMCGETDPNRKEMEEIHKQFTDEKRKVIFKTFPGGHVAPPVELGKEAVRWMTKKPEKHSPPTLEEELERAQKLKDTDPFGAALLCEQLIEIHRGDVKVIPVRELLKTLEKDPKVRWERKAERELQNAQEYEAKRDADKYRNYIITKFEKVAKRFPDTRAGAKAKARALELESEE